jgi:hypothetical protein
MILEALMNHYKIQRKHIFTALFFFAASLLSACEPITTDSASISTESLANKATYYLEVVEGASQSVKPNTTFEPITVRLTNSGGNPVPGELLFFTIENVAATLSTLSEVTDSTGSASIALTSGNFSGSGRLIVRGISTPTPLVVPFTILPDDPVLILADPLPVYKMNSTFPLRVRVQLVDRFLNPVPGNTLKFTPSDSKITLSTTSVDTSLSGYAEVEVTGLVDVTPGHYGLVVELSSSIKETIYLLLEPGTADRIEYFEDSSGLAEEYCNSKSFTSGTTLKPLCFILRDSDGYPVINSEVEFTLNKTGGTNKCHLSPTKAYTDYRGVVCSTLVPGTSTAGTVDVKDVISQVQKSPVCAFSADSNWSP